MKEAQKTAAGKNSDALRLLEQGGLRAEAVLEAMGDAVSVQDREFRVLYQNRAHQELIGDHRGEYCYAAYQRRDRVCDGCPVALCFESGRPHKTERHTVNDRGEFHVEITASPLTDSAGNVVGGIESVRTIADRWRAENALRDERNFVNTVVDTVASLVLVLDREGRIVRFNRACEKLTGYTFTEVRERYVWDLFILPEEIDRVRTVFTTLKSGMFPNTHVNYWRTRNGGRRLIAWSNTALIDAGGAVEFVIPTGIDITEQRIAEAALAAEKERLAVTLRSIGDGVITTDVGGRVVLVNKVAEELTGWSQEQAAGRPLAEVFHIIHERTRARAEAPIEQVLRTGLIIELANHTALVSRQGTERIIADSAAPIKDAAGTIIGVVLVFRDITEKRRMEEELLKSQRIESLGVLAGGIAHDYNNLLTAILGNINLARTYLLRDDREKARDRLLEAERASARAKDLTHQLLTFSRGGAPVKKATSIEELIRDSASFALRGSGARCEFAFPVGLWSVEVDEGQISQVIHNLIINAAQSLPDEGGAIRVDCGNVHVSPGSGLPLAEGRYIRITVEDEGAGIPPENLQKIFDPYFTTKKKGSGLGLTTSYSIIKKHEGHIAVESGPGKGSKFHVYLPAAGDEVKAAPRKEDVLLSGKGRILVMDDEEVVRNVASSMLASLGYDVELAKDGDEAVRLYREARQAGKPYDAVIMDLTVPGGKGGKEAVKVLLADDPDIKAVVSSGYSDDAVLSNFRTYGFTDVIGKPYTLQELSRVLHAVLRKADA